MQTVANRLAQYFGSSAQVVYLSTSLHMVCHLCIEQQILHIADSCKEVLHI